MIEYTIRPAGPDDLDQIWALVRRAVAKMNAEGSEQWGEDYPTRAHYADDIRRGELICAVTPQGRVLGAACASMAPEESYAEVPWAASGPALVVHRAAVDPEVQRAGVAAALMGYAEDLARRGGAAAMHVDTYSKNGKMQGLFRKLGFVQRGEIHLHGRELGYPAFEKEL